MSSHRDPGASARKPPAYRGGVRFSIKLGTKKIRAPAANREYGWENVLRGEQTLPRRAISTVRCQQTCRLNAAALVAALDVVVDHADGLHKGIYDRAAHETHPALLQVLGQRVGFLGVRAGTSFIDFGRLTRGLLPTKRQT